MKRIIVLAALGMLLLALTGCRVRPTAAPRETSAYVVAGETEVGDDPEGTGEATDSEPSGPVVPADIPLPQGIYELQVMREGAQIEFRVDGTLEDVTAFFQAELPQYGWEETRTPDAVVGSMGSIVRVNENGDTLSINLQFNQFGNYCSVQINISREE